jgi:hypothetical protein
MILFLLALIAPDFHLELSRSSCAGTCPVYRVTVDAHGAVTFDGLEMTSVIGIRRRALTVDELEELAGVVRGLRDATCSVMDAPRSTIRVRQNGRETTVRRNGGCVRLDVEDRIDAITGIGAWKKYDARLANRRMVVRYFGSGCRHGVDCETQAKNLAQNALVLFRTSRARLRIDRDGTVNGRAKLKPEELRRLKDALAIPRDRTIHRGEYVQLVVPVDGELRPFEAPADSIPAVRVLRDIIAAYGSSTTTHR